MHRKAAILRGLFIATLVLDSVLISVLLIGAPSQVSAAVVALLILVGTTMMLLIQAWIVAEVGSKKDISGYAKGFWLKVSGAVLVIATVLSLLLGASTIVVIAMIFAPVISYGGAVMLRERLVKVYIKEAAEYIWPNR